MSESNLGVCPCCDGTGFGKELTEQEKKYWWNKDKTHEDCRNCGGQYMYGKPTGKVRLRRDNGEPCTHKYSGYSAGRCLTRYTCEHCGDRYDIDSGD